MGEVNLAKAQEVFDALCQTLDQIDFKYEAKPEEFAIVSGMSGDDFPMGFLVRVLPENELVQFISFLPFKISEEKRVDLAVAVCTANNKLLNGSFDYDISDGTISFRMASSYRESTIGKELFMYMIVVSTNTIDSYNDKFFMLDKNLMTLKQFIENEND